MQWRITCMITNICTGTKINQYLLIFLTLSPKDLMQLVEFIPHLSTMPLNNVVAYCHPYRLYLDQLPSIIADELD